VNIAESRAQSAKREERKAWSEKAREHLNIAEKMIEKMGYGWRKPDVAELRQQINPP
jgi:hypothetical protein